MTLLLLCYLQYPINLYFLDELSTNTQNFCNNLYFFELKYRTIYQALGCGNYQTNSIEIQLLKSASLWHLFVVSAGHFYSLKWLLKKIPFLNELLIQLLLLFFCFWTGLQEPAVLAWFCGISSIISNCFNLNWDDNKKTLYCGVICLILFPRWSQSLSLILSLMCRLILNFVQKFNSNLLKGILFFTLLLPLFGSSNLINPTGIIWNLLLGPILSFILFPIAIIAMLFPQTLGSCIDYILDFLFWILTLFQSNSQTNFNEKYKINSDFILLTKWTYVLIFSWVLFIRNQINKI